MTLTPQDSHWMATALKLAEQGLYSTSPNPRVGCVIVKQQQLIGSGWHQRAGEPHAEVYALQQAGEAAQGATAYVTLEPCSHFGRTPPCADALIAAGIQRVVIAMQDPNPQVAGQGIEKLQDAGIEVVCGLMKDSAAQLNIGFISRMMRHRPWLRSKIGASLDGRTALANGQSQWITSPEARQDVQHWRARSCAILTGINTVLADNARLTVRDIPTERQPLRVVLDSQLRLPLDAAILDGGHLLVYTLSEDMSKIEALLQRGVTLVQLASSEIDLDFVLQDLARRGCNEVLLEAGKTLNGAFLAAGLIDELVLYLAPKLLGDQALGLAALGELSELTQSIQLNWSDIRQVGPDLRICATVKRS